VQIYLLSVWIRKVNGFDEALNFFLKHFFCLENPAVGGGFLSDRLTTMGIGLENV
jgi:hypothetical protein